MYYYKYKGYKALKTRNFLASSKVLYSLRHPYMAPLSDLVGGKYHLLCTLTELSQFRASLHCTNTTVVKNNRTTTMDGIPSCKINRNYHTKYYSQNFPPPALMVFSPLALVVFSPPALMAKILSHVNDYVEPMVIFTVWVKIYSTKFIFLQIMQG